LPLTQISLKNYKDYVQKSRPQEIYKLKLTPFPLNAVPFIVLVAKVMPSVSMKNSVLRDILRDVLLLILIA